MRYGGRVVSMAILLVCGVNDEGKREVLALEPMLEESKESYKQLFEGLKSRGLQKPSLVVSGLVAAIGASPGPAGSAVRFTSCATFWCMCPTKRKSALPVDSKVFG